MKESIELCSSLLKEVEEIKKRSEVIIDMLKKEIEKSQEESPQKVSIADLLELPSIMRSVVLKISSYESIPLADLAAMFKDQEDDLPSILSSLKNKGYIEEFEEDGAKKYRVPAIRRKPKKLSVDIWKSLDEKLTKE